MSLTGVLTLITVLFLIATSPFTVWRSLWILTKCAFSRGTPLRLRFQLIKFLIVNISLEPIRSLFWLIDEVLYPSAKEIEVRDPVFIISQPRCGTTLLHRTLAECSDKLMSLTYLEWKYPYIFVWKLIDFFGLRERLNAKCYWPNTSAGQLANKMHPHCYGDFEEHGVFIEEKFFSHYFTFRRFPLPKVLDVVSELSTTDKGRIILTMSTVVQKMMYYKGKDLIWLTKENESASLYLYMLYMFRNPRVIRLTRNKQASMESYLKLSVISTKAKTGIFPTEIHGWSSANRKFRRQELARTNLLFQAIERHDELKHIKVVNVSYEDLVADLTTEVPRILKALQIPADNLQTSLTLQQLQRAQTSRDRGY